jgi:hypothetical protein
MEKEDNIWPCCKNSLFHDLHGNTPTPRLSWLNEICSTKHLSYPFHIGYISQDPMSRLKTDASHKTWKTYICDIEIHPKIQYLCWKQMIHQTDDPPNMNDISTTFRNIPRFQHILVKGLLHLETCHAQLSHWIHPKLQCLGWKAFAREKHSTHACLTGHMQKIGWKQTHRRTCMTQDPMYSLNVLSIFMNTNAISCSWATFHVSMGYPYVETIFSRDAASRWQSFLDCISQFFVGFERLLGGPSWLQLSMDDLLTEFPPCHVL